MTKKRIANAQNREVVVTLRKDCVIINGHVVPALLCEEGVLHVLKPAAASLAKLLDSPAFNRKIGDLLKKPRVKTRLGYQFTQFMDDLLHDQLSLRKALAAVDQFEKKWQHWHDRNRFEWCFKRLGVNEAGEFETKKHKKLRITRLNFQVAKVNLTENLVLVASAPIYQLTGLIFEEGSVFQTPFIIKEVLQDNKPLTEDAASQALAVYENVKNANSVEAWFKHNLLAVRLESLLVGQKLTRRTIGGTTLEVVRTSDSFEVHTDIAIDFVVRTTKSKTINKERVDQIAELLYGENPYHVITDWQYSRYAQIFVNGKCLDKADSQKSLVLVTCIRSHFSPEVYPLVASNYVPKH
jgi:hypothetical protein